MEMKRVVTALALTAMLAAATTGCYTDGTPATQNRYRVADTVWPRNSVVYDGSVRTGMANDGFVRNGRIYDGAARNGMISEGTVNNTWTNNAGGRAAMR